MSLIYDGHDFSTLFVYGDPQITILDAKPDTRDVSGRNGAATLGRCCRYPGGLRLSRVTV